MRDNIGYVVESVSILWGWVVVVMCDSTWFGVLPFRYVFGAIKR